MQGSVLISLCDVFSSAGWARSYDVAQLKASVQRLHGKIDAVLPDANQSAELLRSSVWNWMLETLSLFESHWNRLEMS